MRRPVFPSQRVAIGVGLAGFALAWFALWDAYQARGQDTPRLLRPFAWW